MTQHLLSCMTCGQMSKNLAGPALLLTLCLLSCVTCGQMRNNSAGPTLILTLCMRIAHKHYAPCSSPVPQHQLLWQLHLALGVCSQPQFMICHCKAEHEICDCLPWSWSERDTLVGVKGGWNLINDASGDQYQHSMLSHRFMLGVHRGSEHGKL